MSRPSVVKVADFLLYLRQSLSLSYSSIASHRSLLSGVFRFVVPELSSHFVFHDLFRFFFSFGVSFAFISRSSLGFTVCAPLSLWFSF